MSRSYEAPRQYSGEHVEVSSEMPYDELPWVEASKQHVNSKLNEHGQTIDDFSPYTVEPWLEKVAEELRANRIS